MPKLFPNSAVAARYIDCCHAKDSLRTLGGGYSFTDHGALGDDESPTTAPWK